MAEMPDVVEALPEAAPAAEGEAAPPAEQPRPARSLEEVEAELARTRREAASYRTKLREVEPIAKKAQEAAEAEKTGIQRAEERAQAAELEKAQILENYTRMELGVQYKLDPEDIDLLGSGTREEMDVRAQRLAALTAAAAKATPPPTNQPVEGLRPGASPGPAKEPDDNYPSSWTPSFLKEDRTTQHGQ